MNNYQVGQTIQNKASKKTRTIVSLHENWQEIRVQYIDVYGNTRYKYLPIKAVEKNWVVV